MTSGARGLLRAPAGDVGVVVGARPRLGVTICLSSLPPPPDIPEISVSHVNLTVREGDNAVITCNGSGSPLPDVDWMVAGLQSINTHQVGTPARAAPGGWGPPALSLNETQRSKQETGREGQSRSHLSGKGHGDLILDMPGNFSGPQFPHL